ncbi:hypothetical protein AWC38_SpisGene24043 [Stylophora pistillata]|uniref:Uncharacterized protein n=1 Tax=Stylophora pistillata TaxID=50429 RepID=A0A2B4R6P1_STYPI|nr:hypothetical protein AWC38_SpisGene24043 [Stylophora pistillata]
MNATVGGREALWRWDKCDGSRPEKLEAASRSPTHRRLISVGRSSAEDLGNSRLRQHYSRLPKAVFYGKLRKGKRKQGGQKLRFKDVLKRHMKNANVKSETWEQDTLDRSFWRATVKQSVKASKRSGNRNTSVPMKRDIPLQHLIIHVVAVTGSAASERVWLLIRESASPNINSHHRLKWTADDDIMDRGRAKDYSL